MNSTKPLYDLQELDTQIAARRGALATVRARLEDNQALLFARSEAEEAGRRLKELRSRQREADMEVEALREKIGRLEKRLYGGAVQNPRELSGMEEEQKIVRSRHRQREDTLLEIMISVEEAAAALKSAQANLATVETQWRRDREQLLEEQKRLTGELSTLERQRETMAAQIQPPALTLYEHLRANKQGQAVARVERSMCQGCRITLPTRVLQQARGGQELVQCNSCARILFVV